MYNKIKKKLKSKNAKILIENFTSLSALQMIEYIFPLITLPYLARVIGVEKFGVLAFATAVISYFIAVVDYGFDYTSVRDISKKKDDNYYVSKIFSNVFFARLLLLLISFLILVVLIFTIPFFENHKLILLLTFLQIPGKIMVSDWFFQGIEKMRYITIRSTIAKLIFTILIFVVIRNEEDYIYHPVLLFLGFFISGIFAFYSIFKTFKVKLIIPSIEEIFKTIKNGWNMFLTIFFPNIYSNISAILLQIYGGNYANGIFDAGKKFIAISQKITNILSRTFYPFLARRMDKHSFYRKLSFTISFIITIILFLGANLIINIFYGESFSESVIVLRILSLSIIFMFLTNTFGTNYLVLVNKEKLYRKIIVYCSIIGFFISFYFIYKYSFIGAAITYLAVRALIGITTWFFARKYKNEILNN